MKDRSYDAEDLEASFQIFDFLVGHSWFADVVANGSLNILFVEVNRHLHSSYVPFCFLLFWKFFNSSSDLKAEIFDCLSKYYSTLLNDLLQVEKEDTIKKMAVMMRNSNVSLEEKLIPAIALRLLLRDASPAETSLLFGLVYQVVRQHIGLELFKMSWESLGHAKLLSLHLDYQIDHIKKLENSVSQLINGQQHNSPRVKQRVKQHQATKAERYKPSWLMQLYRFAIKAHVSRTFPLPPLYLVTCADVFRV